MSSPLSLSALSRQHSTTPYVYGTGSCACSWPYAPSPRAGQAPTWTATSRGSAISSAPTSTLAMHRRATRTRTDVHRARPNLLYISPTPPQTPPSNPWTFRTSHGGGKNSAPHKIQRPEVFLMLRFDRAAGADQVSGDPATSRRP